MTDAGDALARDHQRTSFGTIFIAPRASGRIGLGAERRASTPFGRRFGRHAYMTQQQPTPGYPQPQGYGPPHGYPPPQGHPPPPKKSGGLALVLLGVVLGVLGVVGVGAYLV